MDEDFLTYAVQANDKYVYLREVLLSQMQLSHSLLTKLKAQEKIKVNGEVTWSDYRLQPGDLVTVEISLYEENSIEAQDLPLNIVYEDPEILVINKAPNMAVHPVTGIPDGTLANAVSYYWAQQGKSILFRPINRLDKNTSGLMVIGKSQYAHQAMFRQQQLGGIHRSYQAIVEGTVEADRGCINLPIARMDPFRFERSVDPSGKAAVTHFQVVKRYKGYTLLALRLETGRTHQIRVHLSNAGYPICGDFLYGKSSLFINRQALHAGKLSFQQPRTGIPLQFEAPLPLDMIRLLEELTPFRE